MPWDVANNISWDFASYTAICKYNIAMCRLLLSPVQCVLCRHIVVGVHEHKIVVRLFIVMNSQHYKLILVHVLHFIESFDTVKFWIKFLANLTKLLIRVLYISFNIYVRNCNYFDSYSITFCINVCVFNIILWNRLRFH